MLILIGVICILVFIIALMAAWALGWFLWILLIAGVLLILARLIRRRRH